MSDSMFDLSEVVAAAKEKVVSLAIPEAPIVLEVSKPNPISLARVDAIAASGPVIYKADDILSVDIPIRFRKISNEIEYRNIVEKVTSRDVVILGSRLTETNDVEYIFAIKGNEVLPSFNYIVTKSKVFDTFVDGVWLFDVNKNKTKKSWWRWS